MRIASALFLLLFSGVNLVLAQVAAASNNGQIMIFDGKKKYEHMPNDLALYKEFAISQNMHDGNAPMPENYTVQVYRTL